ncbi:MAG: hypothetical protein KF774_10475 [Planctomyces sp.]|nr:hypothetical protein [Planctomyces sp.]
MRFPLIAGLLLAALAIAATAGRAEPPASEPPAAADSRDAAFAAEVRGLLDLGLTPQASSLPRAEARYQAASALRPGDPRLELAYGIVLGRLFRGVDARPHLEAAAANPDRYFPARQHQIREYVKARKYQVAGEALSELARTLETDDPQAPAEAEWIGRIVSCLAGPVSTSSSRAQFRYLNEHLRQSLPAVLDIAYERGFQQLEQEVEELGQTIETLVEESENLAEETRQSVDEELAANRAELKVRADDARDAAKRWDDWVTDETRRIDDALQEMEKQFNDLDSAATSLIASIAGLRLQVDRIERGVFPDRRFGRNLTAPSDRIVVERAQVLEEQKLTMVYAAQQQLSQRAAAKLAERKSVAAQYQQATGRAFAELKGLQKWDERMKRTAERTKQQADRKPRNVVSLETQYRSLSTYDPSDFAMLRRQLLTDVGAAVSDDRDEAGEVPTGTESD